MSHLRLLTTKQVADRLECHPRTVARLVEAGDLVPVAKGEGIRGPMFFDPRAVRRYQERTK